MTQIDFIMAVVIIIGIVSFTVYYVSDNFSNQFAEVNTLELAEAAKTLELKLLNDVLKEDMKLMKVVFEETGGFSYDSSAVISLSGTVNDIHIYDSEMNTIPSTFSNGDLSFNLYLDPGQKKYFNIIYTGSVSSADYLNDANITSRILSEQVYPVISEQKCFGLNYTEYRETEFDNNFKFVVGACQLGLNPPQGTIVVKNVPVVLRSTVLHKEIVKIMVW